MFRISKCKDCGTPNKNSATSCIKCKSTNLIIKEKTFDRDKVFASTVKYYLSKHKTVDEANRIAEGVVKEQEELWKKRKSKDHECQL